MERNKIILQKDKAVLLIIDVQERIYKVMQNYENLVNNIVKLTKGSNILGIPIFYTEQYPKGLGQTIDVIKKEINSEAIQKDTFSSFGAPNLFDELKKQKISQVIVCGIESHVCVQQTVLDLISNGFQVNIPVNAVSSRFKTDFEAAIDRMGKHGAEITTVESVLFELLEKSGTPTFKEISKLIK